MVGLIDTLVEQKTFSGDAISAIADLRKHAEQLEHNLKNRDINIERLDAEKRQIDAKLGAQERKAEEFEKANIALTEEVEKTRTIEKARAVASAKAETLENCFDKVFRNIQVHRSVTSQIPLETTYNDGMGNTNSTVQNYSNREEVVEESK